MLRQFLRLIASTALRPRSLFRKLRTAIGSLTARTPAGQESEFIQFRVRMWMLQARLFRFARARNRSSSSELPILICVVRNGRGYVRIFMDHYMRLGIRSYVFIDNGSTDGTPEALRQYPGVVVLRTTAPYAKYENTMKRFLADTYGCNHWCLCADIDELFDFPMSDRIGLTGFVGYLEQHCYTAVVCQMLDMFPEGPIAEVSQGNDFNLDAEHPFYDVSDIQKPRLYPGSTTIMVHRGGVRLRAFQTLNGLSKISLFKNDGTIETFINWHHTRGARVADVSCVLKHYPFTPLFHAKAEEAAVSGRYGVVVTDEYRNYWRRLKDDPRFTLFGPTAERYTDTNALVRTGFLVMSDAFREFVERADSSAAASGSTALEDRLR